MSKTLNSETTKTVFIAIVGRPNVGKSSLTNGLVGEKLAIVTNKPQTTRTKITGVLTKGEMQYIFLDTPGIHKPRTNLGKRMQKTSLESLAEVDLALMLFEPFGEINDAEKELINGIKAKKMPAIAAINKVDKMQKLSDLNARQTQLENLSVFKNIYAISALNSEGFEMLFEEFDKYAVESPHYFSKDMFTDTPEKVLVSEILREKLLLNLHDELPHGTAVVVERFKERINSDIIDIDVNIFCEKKSHKGMIIGKNGAMLKRIASGARADCEQLLGGRVNLQCWVKVKDDWRDNDFLLNNFGFKN